MKRVLLLIGRRGPGLSEALAGIGERALPVAAGIGSVLASRIDAEVLTQYDCIRGESVLDLLDRLESAHREEPFDGVCTLADDAVRLTAEVAHRLRLRGNEPQDTEAFRDKGLQRSQLQRAGLLVPRWETIRPTSPYTHLDFPVLLKPTQGSGGALVFVVDSPEELKMVLEECHDRVPGAGAVDDDSGFVVEQILQGVPQHPVEGFAPYVSVETASVDGRRQHFAVTDRFPLQPPVLETGMSLPSCLGPQETEMVRAVVDQALDAVGLREGMSHTEVMLTEDGPVIIEVNARLGGAIPYLYPLAGGANLFAAAADCALGQHPELDPPPGQAICVNLQHPLGVTVNTVAGLDDMRDLNGVRAVISLAGPGHTTESLQDTLAALVLAAVPDAWSGVDLWTRCQNLFRATYSTQPPQPHYRRTPDGIVHASR